MHGICILHVSVIFYTQFLVRISYEQAPKPVEHCNCLRLYLLQINELQVLPALIFFHLNSMHLYYIFHQFCEYMMECIVPVNTTVLEFKQQIAKEARDYNLEPAMYEPNSSYYVHEDSILFNLTQAEAQAKNET